MAATFLMPNPEAESMRTPIPASRLRRPAGLWLLAAMAVAALCLPAPPLAAEIFHVELADGHVFDTRYKPEEASWDSNVVLLLTDTGNWIALPKADIAGITTETEAKGFGQVVDTTTIVLGWAANDAPLPEDEARFAAVERLQQMFEQQRQDYTVEQFVEPSEAGQGGLPAYGATPPDFTYFGDLGALGAATAPPPRPALLPAAARAGGGVSPE
jgi:hypothetical protein